MSARKEWERRRRNAVAAAEHALRALDTLDGGRGGARESIAAVLGWLVAGELVPAVVAGNRHPDIDRDADLWLRWLKLRVAIGYEEAAKPAGEGMVPGDIEREARRRLEKETGLSRTTVRRAVYRGIAGTN